MFKLMTTPGNRKIALGWGYLVGVWTLFMTIVIGQLFVNHEALTIELAVALASLGMTPASGLAVVVWGNVQEHRCKTNQHNGGTK